jgi:hypothetical protein
LIEVERALAAGGAHAAAVLETRDLIVRRREQKK